MENENIQQPNTPKTGGLKLMTVFIIVLALHVLVIGGVSAYSMLRGTSSTVAEGTSPESTSTEAAPAATEAPAPEVAAPLVADQATLDAHATAAVSAPELAATPAVEPIIAAPVAPSVATTAPAIVAPTPAQDTAFSAPTVTSSVGSYTVAKGDTLSKIARLHGMKVADLKSLNGLKNDHLKIGQDLKVKSGSSVASSGEAPVVKAASVKTVSAPAVSAKASAGAAYVVSKGDTLTKIAKQFNTTPSAIMAANKLADARKLKIGMKLQIPQQNRQQMTEQQTPEASLEKPVAPSADFAMAR